MSGRPTLVVGAAVVDDPSRPRRLLAARRTAPATLAGGWPIAPTVVMRVWLAELDGEPHLQGSHDAVRWLGPQEWDDVAWLAPDRPVLDRLRRWYAAL